MLNLLAPKYDIDPESVVRSALNLPNFAELNSPVYTHTVVPNLRNLGLLTERTEGQWRALGMLTDSDRATATAG